MDPNLGVLMNEESKGEIIIYRAEDGETRLEVSLKEDTVWLSQAQMCQLFDKNKRTVSEHIRNIFKEGELHKTPVVRKFRTTARDGKSYEIGCYNLDVIISVGYRVKSRRGTQFRIRATWLLKDHCIKGYSVNEKRLHEQNARLIQLQKTVNLLGRVIEGRELARDEAAGSLRVITGYSYTLTLLDQQENRGCP